MAARNPLHRLPHCQAKPHLSSNTASSGASFILESILHSVASPGFRDSASLVFLLFPSGTLPQPPVAGLIRKPSSIWAQDHAEQDVAHSFKHCRCPFLLQHFWQPFCILDFRRCPVISWSPPPRRQQRRHSQPVLCSFDRGYNNPRSHNGFDRLCAVAQPDDGGWT